MHTHVFRMSTRPDQTQTHTHTSTSCVIDWPDASGSEGRSDACVIGEALFFFRLVWNTQTEKQRPRNRQEVESWCVGKHEVSYTVPFFCEAPSPESEADASLFFFFMKQSMRSFTMNHKNTKQAWRLTAWQPAVSYSRPCYQVTLCIIWFTA